MISQRCRHQGRASVFNRLFTSSIERCAAARVTLPISSFSCPSVWILHLSYFTTDRELVSGRHARPMHPDWARGLRDQCIKANVAFHFKQRGEWVTEPPAHGKPDTRILDGTTFYRIGRRKAGR